MSLMRNRKGQSILEYAILLAVVIVALLLMQVFLKRGFQGSLKDSADKMGEQFSPGNTTVYQNRSLSGIQTITEEVATTASTAGFLPAGKTLAEATGTLGLADVYSYSEREGGSQVSETAVKTDSATKEKFKLDDFTSDPETASATWTSAIPSSVPQ